MLRYKRSMPCWYELANAVTMISPLICWLYHRRTAKRHHNVRQLHRFMIVHIPISVAYHGFSAIGVHHKTIGLLRIVDLALIQIHALLATSALWSKQRQHYLGAICRPRRMAFRLSQALNIQVASQLAFGTEHMVLRLGSLYLSAFCTVPFEPAYKPLTVVGIVSSMLYITDTYFHGLGHPTFHILLGYFHHLTIGAILSS